MLISYSLYGRSEAEGEDARRAEIVEVVVRIHEEFTLNDVSGVLFVRRVY